MNAKGILGEKHTGYEDGSKGEFECQNCRYFSDNSCGQADMMKYSTQPRAKGSRRVLVDPEGCCEFISRVGRKDED